MLKTCVVCGNLALLKGINAKYMAQVCSGECFTKLLKTKEAGFYPPPNSFLVKEDASEMRSSYERGFASWLRERSIQYIYEKYLFPVNKKGFYLPDFFIPSSNIFIEVKGKWEGSGKSKFRYFNTHFPHRIYIMDKEAMKLIGCRPEKGAFYGSVS